MTDNNSSLLGLQFFVQNIIIFVNIRVEIQFEGHYAGIQPKM